MRIGTKLAICFFSIILLVGIGGIWSCSTLTGLRDRYDRLLSQTYPATIAAISLDAEIRDQSQMLMAFATTLDTDLAAGFTKSRETSDRYMDELKAEAAENPSTMDTLNTIEDQRLRLARMAANIYVDSDSLAPDQLILSAEQARSVGISISDELRDIVALKSDELDQEKIAVAAMAERVARIQTLIPLAILFLCVFIMIMNQLVVVRPIGWVTDQLRRIADGAGDLTCRVQVKGGDELGLLADSFNHMQETLSQMVREIVESSRSILSESKEVEQSVQEVAAAVEHVQSAMRIVADGAASEVESATAAEETMDALLDAISQIATGASMQAMQVHDTTDVVTAILRAMNEATDYAAEVSAAATETGDIARQGVSVIKQGTAGMEHVRQQVLMIAQQIESLGRYRRRAGETMAVIKEIADQTNILAQAAFTEVPAASEGYAGSGIMGSHVGQLAARIAQAAQSGHTLLEQMQDDTAETVATIRESARDAEQLGASLTASADQALQEIMQSVESTTSGICSISNSATEMLEAMQSVARAVEEVAAVAEENSASAEQMAAGSNEVSDTIRIVKQISLNHNSAVDEVSASIEEVTQSMWQIGQSTNGLTTIAEQLRTLISRFKVG